MKMIEFFELLDRQEKDLGVALGLDKYLTPQEEFESLGIEEKMKQKKVYNKKKSDQKSALRIPTPPKDFTFKNKKAYNRREKHKKDYM